MKASPVIDVDFQDEIIALVHTLNETQQRLQELAGGELDAILLPGGNSYLLLDAQEKLRESEKRFRGTFEQAAVGMAHVSREGKFLRTNDKLCEITGYSRDELLQMSFLELTMPEDRATGLAANRAMLAGEIASYNVEKRYLSKSGKIIWVNLVTALEPMTVGVAQYFISVFVDITPRKLAEEKLAASEVLLRQFIQHTPAAIAMLDTQMCYMQTSERWMEDYHLTRQQIIGRSHYEIFPDAPPRWKEIHQRVLAGAIERCDEDCFPRADGTTDWLQWEAFPWRQAGGQIGGLIFFTQVITERKRAELALRENEERFREISAQLAKVLDSSLDVICVFDAKGCFLQVSAACEKIWGYRPEELIGTPYLSRVFAEDLCITEEAGVAIMAGQPTTSFENRYMRKDGSIANISWSAWWSEADQNMFCVARDCTETRRAEREARELADRLALATKASKVGIWDLDMITQTLHWDEQMYTLFGVTPGDAGGLELWQRHLHPDDEEKANAELAEACRVGGKPFDTFFRIRIPPDNVIRHIRAQGHVFRDEKGHPIRILGTNWDISEQVAREDILREKLENEGRLLQQAIAGEKAKSDFLAVMSHEIRTPMNSVLGFAEMLTHSSTLTPDDRDLSQTIVSSGEVLLRILDDILDFSSMEAGHIAIEKSIFSPRRLVQGIEQIFARQCRDKDLQFTVTMAESVPEMVEGDEGRIRQILSNLIGNALKFTDHGFIQLEAEAVSGENGENVLEFTVRDTGTGIASEKTDVVFEAFTQEDSSISRHHGGTGLGLTISRRLAELMDGSLKIDSSPDQKGAVFILRVPFVCGKISRAPVSDIQARLPMTKEFGLLYPQSVLVVEDDRINLKLMIGMLEKLGYHPFSARNGVEAVAICLRENPECIFMDVQMPGMGGIEATRKIRSHEFSDHLRPAFISALTANILPENQQQCLEAGMNAYLNKPVRGEKIMKTLIESVRFHGSRN